jgi:hypothetical protein
MSVMTCTQVRELAPELALGILGGAERAEVVLHVNGCARCQAVVSELTEVADTLPQLVPEVEPPPGFESRVLHELGAGERRTRRRWIAAVAAVAAAVAIVTLTTVRVIESNDATSTSGHQVAAPVAVSMQGGSTQSPVGWAYVTGGHSVAISVDYGLGAGSYTVHATPAGGDSTALGTMQVTGGTGSWTGKSDEHLGAGSRISLVDASGTEVCHGMVPTAG